MPLAALALCSACGDGGSGAQTPPVTSPNPPTTPTPTPAPTPTPTPTPAPTVTVAVDFSAGTDGWLADYADYTQGQEASIAFRVEHREVDGEPGTRGFWLTSRNVSDDVFMYVTRPVTGLAPGRRYRVDADVEIATRAAPGCAGVGGSPGEGVVVKVGASPVLPAPILSGTRITTSFDKGEQQLGGSHAVPIGDIAQTAPGSCTEDNPFRTKWVYGGGRGPVVAADAEGRLWPVAGFDSGYEGITAVFLLRGRFTLTPQ